MPLDERVGWLLLGMAIGLVLGEIVRRLDGIQRKIDALSRYRNESGAFHWKDAALLAVVALTAWAAIASQIATNQAQETQHNIVKGLCNAGADTRHVQRATVDAIFNLATGAVQRDSNAPSLSDKRLKMYNDYVDRVNTFRESMYNQIKPPPNCAPYVSDFNVEPPTPPFEHFTQ